MTGFIAKEYTPRMKSVTAAALGSALMLAAPQTPPRTPAQAPPDTEVYLAPLKIANGAIDVGAALNISNNPGYDNQPSFTPDGRAILFTSVRGGAAQTDIYRYDLASREVSRVTNTPEAEYSPTIAPDGKMMSVVRVEADGTQRLWSVLPSGPKIAVAVILPDVKPVGYHAWSDDHTVALFVLGQPATLQLADTGTGAARTIASDIGRSIQAIPGSGARDISFVQRERTGGGTRLIIKRLHPATAAVSTLTPAVEDSTEADTAWTPDGTLLMAHGGALYAWKEGQSGWREVVNLERLSLRGVTRLAVSPKGDFLALVGSPR
jgi:dipeptidyl aminopeptidase/acylaminoacyl peptidase